MFEATLGERLGGGTRSSQNDLALHTISSLCDPELP